MYRGTSCVCRSGQVSGSAGREAQDPVLAGTDVARPSVFDVVSQSEPSGATATVRSRPHRLTRVCQTTRRARDRPQSSATQADASTAARER
jgi:hypothetical protein